MSKCGGAWDNAEESTSKTVTSAAKVAKTKASVEGIRLAIRSSIPWSGAEPMIKV